ncbi:hypothetical protein ACFYOV_32935 [Streptomyces sp. NPDC005931]|uniref:hypothetical protein n=1 Tax=Streptomyces sp. NPDC005931 TaxID=3364737 RepID=UPI0036888F76
MVKRIGAIAFPVAAVTLGLTHPVQASVDAQRTTQCTTLWLKYAKSADVCKTYWPVGGGYYDGYVETKRADGIVSVQVKLDGYPHTLTTQGMVGKQNFTRHKEVLLRACLYNSTSTCGLWW